MEARVKKVRAIAEHPPYVEYRKLVKKGKVDKFPIRKVDDKGEVIVYLGEVVCRIERNHKTHLICRKTYESRNALAVHINSDHFGVKAVRGIPGVPDVNGRAVAREFYTWLMSVKYDENEISEREANEKDGEGWEVEGEEEDEDEEEDEGDEDEDDEGETEEEDDDEDDDDGREEDEEGEDEEMESQAGSSKDVQESFRTPRYTGYLMAR